VRDRRNLVFLIALLPIARVALFAHHGTAVYDTSKLVTVKGTVTAWSWTNPHCLLEFDVKDDNGNVAHWVAETSNPTDMVNRGWSKRTFKPGDEVTVSMIAAKNGRPLGRVQQVVLNGQALVAERPPANLSNDAGKP
jgi:hypothetical protein